MYMCNCFRFESPLTYWKGRNVHHVHVEFTGLHEIVLKDAAAQNFLVEISLHAGYVESYSCYNLYHMYHLHFIFTYMQFKHVSTPQVFMQYTSTSCQVTQMYDVYPSMKCVEASSYAPGNTMLHKEKQYRVSHC